MSRKSLQVHRRRKFFRDVSHCVWGDCAFNDSTSCSCHAAGTGSTVTDLIFSIAKREVTFLSGTALINLL
jgi:hypothetical protein